MSDSHPSEAPVQDRKRGDSRSIEMTQNPSSEDQDTVPIVVHVKRTRSSADTLRKVSDSRLLGDSDLRMAVSLHKKMSETKLKSKMSDPKIPVPETIVDIPDESEMTAPSAPKFKLSHGLTSPEAAELLQQYGRNELPEKIVPKWYIFVSQLWQPMPLMIWAAAIIEAGIQNWIDMSILIFINILNASIGFYEITKAGDAVAALKASLKPRANVKRDGKWQEIDAALLVPGDLVSLAIGGAIPADCIVNDKEIEVDQAALTGESLPVTMYPGDSCKMGSTVARGETEATVEFTGANTFFGKTAALLTQTEEVSNLQTLLMSIMMVLVVISITLCVIVFIYLVVGAGIDGAEALSFVVVLLVASIPLAIEVVTTTTLAIGSKELSHDGAIVTRLAAIEDMAGMSILCSDKTGTLTLNKMVIQEETPVYRDGETQYTLLRYAAMAAKWHEPPKDALDTLTLGAVDLPSLDSVEQTNYVPFDPMVKRTEGSIRDKKTGQTWKTTKGAPHILLKLVDQTNPHGSVMCGGQSLSVNEVKNKVMSDVHRLGMRGIRSLAVAKTCDGDESRWEMLGLLTFLDPPRPDTKQTIEDSHSFGVAVKMITGDHLLIAKETASQLSLGDFIMDSEELPLLDPETKLKPANLSRDYGDLCLTADGFAQVFPEHKFLIVECLRELGYKVGMTGDGVNDAPALKRADVGVAVCGATDAARAAADIVLTKEGLSTIVTGIKVSRKIFCRIRNFIVYRVAATLQLLVFFFIAVFWFKPKDYMPADWKQMNAAGTFPDSKAWPEFFHMPVLMLMLITLLNDGTLISIGYDNVTPSKTPEVWNRRVLFVLASVLALVALISSLLLLGLMLSSWHPTSLFAKTAGLGGLSYGQITTAIYLKVSISDFLTLFSSRTGGDPFFSTAPAAILIGAGGIALSLSTILACAWPASYPDGIYALGLGRRKPELFALWIWIYCIIWWFIQDACKVAVMKFMLKYNIFGINNTGGMKLTDAQHTFKSKKITEVSEKLSQGGGHH